MAVFVGQINFKGRHIACYRFSFHDNGNLQAVMLKHSVARP
jgi:hypothetical protein